MISRKQFFKMLGFGAAAVVAAPTSGWAEMFDEPTRKLIAQAGAENSRPPLNTFLPASEVLALQHHLKEAAKDSDYNLVTNYSISEVFKVMHHYRIQPAPGTLIVEADGFPTSVVMDLKKKIDSDPDFRNNLPSRGPWPYDAEDLKPFPPVEDLITNWFIFS
jgi:hypothetical protein